MLLLREFLEKAKIFRQQNHLMTLLHFNKLSCRPKRSFVLHWKEARLSRCWRPYVLFEIRLLHALLVDLFSFACLAIVKAIINRKILLGSR